MKFTSKDRSILQKVTPRPELEVPIVQTFAESGWAGAIEIGIVRRLTNDDPTELIRGALISIRHRWNSFAWQRAKNRFQDALWREILVAAAIHDWELFEKMVRDLPSEGRGPSDPSCDLKIYETLLGILRGTHDPVRYARHKAFEKSRRPITSSIIGVLDAVISCSALSFAKALQDLAESARADRTLTPEDRLVCLFAHGFWEVANYVDPSNVSSWDVNSSLPWDKGLHRFTRDLEDAASLIRDQTKSEHLLDLIELRELRHA